MVQGAFDDADGVDDDEVDEVVVNLDCESLNLLCDMGDDVAGLFDEVLLKLPKSLKMSMRRSLLYRLPLTVVILSRQL